MQPEITVQLVQQWDPEEIADLYRAGGWWKEEYTVSEIPSLIRGSFLFAVAVCGTTKRAVGMGRVISDGISDGYIQDLVVLPPYRGSGVGRQIIKALVDACNTSGIGWLGLVAEPGTEAFYTPLGFHPMKGHVPLLYQRRES